MPRNEAHGKSNGKTGPGVALCPRCGSMNLSYNSMYKTWRCNSCERSFPSPSYGARGKPRSSWWARLKERFKI